MSTVEGSSTVSGNAKTQAEQVGATGLGKSYWEYEPGKRVPGYYTRLVDGIVYDGLKRIPPYEEHSPPFDLYLLALEVPPEPKRVPITEKRFPPFPKFRQSSATAVISPTPTISTAITLVSEEGIAAEPILSYATGSSMVSSEAGTESEPVGVSAEPA